MRFAPLAALLLVAGFPAAAAPRETTDQRIDRIEKELNAVQRKVFPGGAGAIVEPDIPAAAPAAPPPGVPATNALADIATRLDAIEAQVRTLTGQAELEAHRLDLLEQGLAQLRAAGASAPATPAPGPADLTGNEPVPGDVGSPPGTSADPGEAAYSDAYRLWSNHHYPEAAAALQDMINKYPNHPRSSFAQNLLGRALLDGGKPTQAAAVLLANYQKNPKGERAQDSLYFLGQALVQLNQRTKACEVYDELQNVYGASMRSWVKDRLPKARQDARCA